MKKNINNSDIIEVSAKLANEVGLDNLLLKMIAKELDIKSPSLYNHISSLDDIRKKIMIYGWKNVEIKMVNESSSMVGYDALRKMCYSFYDYAVNNKGVFSAMLWYNMYEDEDSFAATERLHNIIYKIMESLNINENNIKHCIRLTRSFLEGFSLLVNNNAFGDPLSIKESFDVSVEILISGIKSLENK